MFSLSITVLSEPSIGIVDDLIISALSDAIAFILKIEIFSSSRYNCLSQFVKKNNVIQGISNYAKKKKLFQNIYDSDEK